MTKKKKNIILGFVIIAITLIACISIYIIGKKFNDDSYLYPYFHELNINQLEEKIANKDSFILVITQTGCSHCEAYLPIVKKVSNSYNIDFFVYNRTTDYKNDKSRVNKIATISGTPTTLFFINGSEKTTLNRLVGEVTEYRLIEKLKSEGYINE